ncbi:MAG: MAPEG family protein [Pseudomonadota bacterium]
MPMLPATFFLTGIFALMLVILSLNVSFRRRAVMVGYGDGDDKTLRVRMRAHGNFIENAPLAILVCAGLEFSGTAGNWVWLVALAFIISRLLHALGTLYVPGPAPRGAAMVIQHVSFVLAGVWLIVLAF